LLKNAAPRQPGITGGGKKQGKPNGVDRGWDECPSDEPTVNKKVKKIKNVNGSEDAKCVPTKKIDVKKENNKGVKTTKRPRRGDGRALNGRAKSAKTAIGGARPSGFLRGGVEKKNSRNSRVFFRDSYTAATVSWGLRAVGKGSGRDKGKQDSAEEVGL